jgi:mRNA-degrading endonuclease RelE of RelBE toxin-antitoxin system
MNFNVRLTPEFQKNAKRLVKKYPSLKMELNTLLEQLEKNPIYGIQIMEGVYKVRLAIKSKNKGKSGGARTIHFIYQAQKTEEIGKVYLLTIYDKSDQDSVAKASLEEVIEGIKKDSEEE